MTSLDHKYVVVPVEPTEEMLADADSAIPRAERDIDGARMMGREVALEAWKAMISASPISDQVAVPRETALIVIELLEQASCTSHLRKKIAAELRTILSTEKDNG